MLPYENIELEDLDGEIWIDAIGFDGIYEVSNLGRVKSLGRWVPNGKSERWVKEKILRQGKQKKDNRLSVMLSQNNIAKSYSISSLVYYSFNPEVKNDNLRDEVYHINKVQNDNRLVNLGYNEIQGASYKISIELGNVKHLEKARKAVHKYTKETAIIKNGVVTNRKCRVCNQLKKVNLFGYKRNTCLECRKKEKKEAYLKNTKGKVFNRNNKDVYITDTVTEEVFICSNKNKCIISRALVNRYANTNKLVFPCKNSKHKNPLLVEIKERTV